jgi:anti-sigma28 factor (negative regulator of flagellin synthesis)
LLGETSKAVKIAAISARVDDGRLVIDAEKVDFS